MNSLADALKDYRVVEQKPSLPAVQRTPMPERGKVVSNPVRVAVNRQAAFVTRPERSWIHQPLADPPTPNHQKEIDELKAQLKTERNDHAMTRDDLGNARMRLREARSEIAKLQSRLADAQHQITEKEGIIRQLEDIKL